MASVANLITGQVEGLRTEMTTLINGISGRVQALEVSDALTAAQIAQINADVAVINSSISTLNTRVGSLESAASDLAGQLANLRNDMMSITMGLQGQVNNNHLILQSQISQLSLDILGLQAAATGTQSLVSREIGNAETNLCPLGSGGTEVSLCVLSGA